MATTAKAKRMTARGSGRRRASAKTGATDESVPRGNGRQAVVILSAYPKKRPAERAARDLVHAGLLACATVTYGARAYYRWNGKNHNDASTMLWGKTTADKAAEAVRSIGAAHPDDVPEILVLPVAGGHRPYLDWLADETSGQERHDVKLK